MISSPSNRCGLKTLHVLFFIDLHTRKVLIGGVTDGAANAAWCAQIARNLSEAQKNRANHIKYLVHDRDKRFCAVFDEVFRAEGIKILRTPWRAPRANAYAERFIRTVRTECLDRFFIVNEKSSRLGARDLCRALQHGAPTQGLGLVPPDGEKMVTPITASDPVKRRDRLGGLIHEYHRAAA